MANNPNNSTLLSELRKKYKNQEFYTYISEMLIALNPNAAINELYAKDKIQKYTGVSLGDLPAHVFAIADNAIRNLRAFEVPQSIIINGVTGSGKTETTKNLLKFFFGTKSTPFERMIPEANILLEAFGNSSTIENFNSSRFIKHFQINYDSKFAVVGSKIETYLFENSRVCVGSYSNFHIFYYLRYGAPDNLKRRLSLEYSFLSLPEKSKILACQNSAQDFAKVDQIFSILQITEDKRNMIYDFLAAILHLNNIEFGSNDPDDLDEQTYIIETTEHHVEIAAHLLKYPADKLRNLLLYHSIKCSESRILCPFNSFAARKTRDSLVKLIYKNLVQFIVSSINDMLAFDSTKTQESNKNISILDIAGFECFDLSMNLFEQFCINYANEKIQNFCTQRLIYKEQEWYKAEGLNLPEISFPGNDHILDLLENKTFGIFQLLDNECKMKKPSLKNFMNIVNSTHKNSHLFPKLLQSRAKTELNSFIIRHFAQDVQYTTENFIENNTEKCSDSILSFLAQNSTLLYFGSEDKSTEMPTTSNTRVTKNTASSKFRMDLNLLLTSLNSTKSHFVQCIKANTEHAPGNFNGDFISRQLTSSGAAAYYELMQIGFPAKVEISALLNQMDAFLRPREISLGKNLCCYILLLAVGFKPNEFKIGKTEILIRPGKNYLIDKLNDEIRHSKNEIELRFKASFLNFMRRILYARFQLLGKMFLNKKKAELRRMPRMLIAVQQDEPNEEQKNMQSTHENAGDSAEALSEKMKLIDMSEKSVMKRRLSSENLETLKTPKTAKTTKTTKTPRETMPLNSIRFNGLQHDINYDNPNEPRKGFRCKFESCGLPTTVYCEVCKVHLCFVTGKNGRNCFKHFHNLSES